MSCVQEAKTPPKSRKKQKWWSQLSVFIPLSRSKVPIPLATRGSAKLTKRLRIIATPMSSEGMSDAKMTAKPPSVTPTARGRGKAETAAYSAA